MLFPLDDAETIEPSTDLSTRLIVPDGSWHQARKVVRRELTGFRTLKLPAGPPGELRIRHHVDPAGVSTLEAIARVLAITGRGEAAAALMRVFRMMVARTLWIRGDIPADQVYGGLPEGAEP